MHSDALKGKVINASYGIFSDALKGKAIIASYCIFSNYAL